MKALFLTSSLNTNIEDENGNKIPIRFENKNNILDNFKKYIKKYDNFLYIASNPEDYLITDFYSNVVFKSFDLTLPFKNYIVLDNRNIKEASKLVSQADFIYLAGGHVPTQNKFFNNINLNDLVNKNNDVVVCGVSAGSMNCSDIVYSPPEEEGEAIDINYNRYLKGLGLTKININPHYIDDEVIMLDGLDIKEDILLKDSKRRSFFAYPDGTYILKADNSVKIYGLSYRFENGTCHKFSNDKEVKDIGKYDI